MVSNAHFLFYCFLISVILFEFAYSKFKKDSIHSSQDTFVNTSSFVIGILIRDYLLSILYISFFMSIIFSFVKTYVSPLPNSATSFILCFLMLDLIFYFVHRMHHSLSFFWAIHSTHHSDNYLNASTFLRSSWFQKAYQWLFLTIPLFFGFSQPMVLYCLAFIYTYQLLVHSQYINFPKWLDKILVTSRSHSLHHDEAVKNQKCNFGEVLNIWDVLFGTYKYKNEYIKVTFGINEKHQNTLWTIQTYELKKYLGEKTEAFKRWFFRARISPL